LYRTSYEPASNVPDNEFNNGKTGNLTVDGSLQEAKGLRRGIANTGICMFGTIELTIVAAGSVERFTPESVL